MEHLSLFMRDAILLDDVVQFGEQSREGECRVGNVLLNTLPKDLAYDKHTIGSIQPVRQALLEPFVELLRCTCFWAESAICLFVVCLLHDDESVSWGMDELLWVIICKGSTNCTYRGITLGKPSKTSCLHGIL